LDSIFHQPNWEELPSDVFRVRVADAVEQDGWVVDGNYGMVRDLVWQRADTVVWLDLPRSVVMRRVILRSLRRAVTREVLWNGNREPLSNFRLDPAESVIRETWVGYDEGVRRHRAAMDDPGLRHLRFLRLTSQREIDAFLKHTA
jgi:adenylate kinase family enzyme